MYAWTPGERRQGRFSHARSSNLIGGRSLTQPGVMAHLDASQKSKALKTDVSESWRK